MLSLFPRQEIVETSPSTRRIYSAAQLHGEGLQRLSYFVESGFVTRRFKNHLKRLGIFSPKVRKQDREQVFVERQPIRRYSDKISNRKFKSLWKKTHHGIHGLKEQPRTVHVQQPLHIGTLHKSRGRYYPNPLLTKWERRGLSRPIRWAKRFLKKAVKKVLCESRKLEEPGIDGPGQPPTSPVGPHSGMGSFVSKRVVLMSKDGTAGVVGGQALSSYRQLANRWPDGTFRFFVLVNNRITYVGNSLAELDEMHQ